LILHLLRHFNFNFSQAEDSTETGRFKNHNLEIILLRQSAQLPSLLKMKSFLDADLKIYFSVSLTERPSKQQFLPRLATI